MKRILPILFAFLLSAIWVFAQAPATRLNPAVKAMADSISADRIAATLRKLEGFGTRYVLSAQVGRVKRRPGGTGRREKRPTRG